MILPQEHDYLYLSEEALLTQGFFVHEFIHWQLSSFIEISLLCIHADTVTIPNDKRLPPGPSWISSYRNTQGAPCVSLMVDKMVDVDVPLTMNWRGVNISNHKG